jgi:hypothetical protein
MDFEEYWHAYLQAHALPQTRVCHYAATAVGALGVIVCVTSANFWFLPIGLAASYAIGALGHVLFERNEVVVQNRPFWSLACCLRMTFSALTGHIDEDLSHR